MPPTFSTGDVIANQFRVAGLLGSGGQGAVYHAHDELADGREVALKVVEFQPHEQTKLSRIASEYSVLGKLSHPNIIAVHGAGRLAENQCYIAMEFVKGKTLETRIGKQAGSIAFDESLRILQQVALGLEAAHAAKVIHRDLKPANILITEEGVVKIIDFGLARDLDQGMTLTQDGRPTGTVAYMSPEQLLRKDKLDHRTDIYSFGIVAFEMITGSPPFVGDEYYALATSHLYTQAQHLSPKEHGIPEWFGNTVGICLQKKAADRFQSVTEIRERLEQRMRKMGLLEGAVKRPNPVSAFFLRLIGEH